MLDVNLEQLEHKDLIRRAPVPAALVPLGGEYAFKHGLVQETTYESLLRHDRRRLHRLVAQALEESGQANELAALLARHWDEAGEGQRAFDYYVVAGENAARIYANAEALMAYDRAIVLSGALDLSPERLQQVYLARGRAYELNAQYTEALENYSALEQIARVRGDRALELAAHLAQIPIYAVPNARFDRERAAHLIAQALALADELHDRAAQARARWLRMLLYARSNRPDAAAPEGEAALRIARELNLRELLAYAANDLAGVYASNGDFARSAVLAQEANGLWRELGNLPMLADNLSSIANRLIYTGDLDTVIRLSAEAHQISEKIGNLWGQSYSLFSVGLAHVERGDFALGIDEMETCLAVGDRAGFLAPHLDTQLDLARAYGWFGAVGHALEIGRRALQEIQVFPIGLPLCYATLVELYVEAGDYKEAETALAHARETFDPANNLSVYEMHIERSAMLLAGARAEWARVCEIADRFIPQMKQLSVRLYLADAYLFRARALFALGESDQAVDAIGEADTIARAIGSQRLLWQILALSAEIDKAQGKGDRAVQTRQQAREILHYLADHAPPALRETFLNRPDVRAVIDPAV